MADLALAEVGLAPRRRFLLLRRLARHRSFQIGFTIVAVVALCALLGPWLTGIDPTTMRLRFRSRAPAREYLFGTDMFGRDLLTRVLYGARLSLWIGLATAVLSGGI